MSGSSLLVMVVVGNVGEWIHVCVRERERRKVGEERERMSVRVYDEVALASWLIGKATTGFHTSKYKQVTVW